MTALRGVSSIARDRRVSPARRRAHRQEEQCLRARLLRAPSGDAPLASPVLDGGGGGAPPRRAAADGRARGRERRIRGALQPARGGLARLAVRQGICLSADGGGGSDRGVHARVGKVRGRSVRTGEAGRRSRAGRGQGNGRAKGRVLAPRRALRGEVPGEMQLVPRWIPGRDVHGAVRRERGRERRRSLHARSPSWIRGRLLQGGGRSRALSGEARQRRADPPASVLPYGGLPRRLRLRSRARAFRWTKGCGAPRYFVFQVRVDGPPMDRRVEGSPSFGRMPLETREEP